MPDGLLVQRVRGFGGCENIFGDFGAMHFLTNFLHVLQGQIRCTGPQKTDTGTCVRLFFVWWVPDGLLVQRVGGFGGWENIFGDFGGMHFLTNFLHVLQGQI